jgi:hypothetical protein
LNSLSPPFFFTPLPIPGIVSTGLNFPFKYMCTQYLHHTHPPHPFPTSFPCQWYQLPLPLPDRDCSTLLFCNFVKEKLTFLFVWDSYTGSFLVTFSCIYVL